MHAQQIKPHIGSKAWFIPETGELEIRDNSDGTISSVARGCLELTLAGLSLELDTRKGGNGTIRVPLRQIGAIKDRRKQRETTSRRKASLPNDTAETVTRVSLRPFVGCYAWWLREAGVLQIRGRSEARITSVTSSEVVLALEGFARKGDLKRGGDGTMAIPISTIRDVEDNRPSNGATSSISSKNSPGYETGDAGGDRPVSVDLHRLARLHEEKLNRRRGRRRNIVLVVFVLLLVVWVLREKLEATSVLLTWFH